MPVDADAAFSRTAPPFAREPNFLFIQSFRRVSPTPRRCAPYARSCANRQLFSQGIQVCYLLAPPILAHWKAPELAKSKATPGRSEYLRPVRSIAKTGA